MKNIFFRYFLWRSVPYGATALTKLRHFIERIKILQPAGLISKLWIVPSYPHFTPFPDYFPILVSIGTSEPSYTSEYPCFSVYDLDAFRIFHLSLFISSVYCRPMLIPSCIGPNRIWLLEKCILMKWPNYDSINKIQK